MGKAKAKWGETRAEMRTQEGEWTIGTREFVHKDGSFWQYKIARNLWSFTDPIASTHGWVSTFTSRHRIEFASREIALAAAKAKIAQVPSCK